MRADAVDLRIPRVRASHVGGRQRSRDGFAPGRVLVAHLTEGAAAAAAARGFHGHRFDTWLIVRDAAYGAVLRVTTLGLANRLGFDGLVHRLRRLEQVAHVRHRGFGANRRIRGLVLTRPPDVLYSALARRHHAVPPRVAEHGHARLASWLVRANGMPQRRRRRASLALPARNVRVFVRHVRRALRSGIVPMIANVLILAISVGSSFAIRLVLHVTSRFDHGEPVDVARAVSIRRHLEHVSIFRRRRHFDPFRVPPVSARRAASRASDELDAADRPRHVLVVHRVGDAARVHPERDRSRVRPERETLERRDERVRGGVIGVRADAARRAREQGERAAEGDAPGDRPRGRSGVERESVGCSARGTSLARGTVAREQRVGFVRASGGVPPSVADAERHRSARSVGRTVRLGGRREAKTRGSDRRDRFRWRSVGK